MSLLPVAEALEKILAAIPEPVAMEEVPIAQGAGRTLAADLTALRTQPPFPASAMDGYAVRSADLATVPVRLRLIGTSAAGHGFSGTLQAGEAVRIFTGAPVPEGADAILIQENAATEGETVTAREPVAAGRFLRRAGLDFREGETLVRAGDTLDARRLALAAGAGHAVLPVRRKPRVAVLATGDELVRPGERAAWDQIVASNGLALGALSLEAGAEVIDLGIVRDDLGALREAVGRARAAGADLLVTLGGASVGDHDLVQAALGAEGMELGFWRVALRPGKPLMHGRIGAMTVIGLPGNPVSSIVCGHLFAMPLVEALLGIADPERDRSEAAILAADLPANDERQDYLRATTEIIEGERRVRPFAKQDSSMLANLSRAEALVIRPAFAEPAKAGEPCRIIKLR